MNEELKPQHTNRETLDLVQHKALYPDWLEKMRPHLEASDWATAFRTYPSLRFPDGPWQTPTLPLSASRIGLFSTAGAYISGDQPPFDAENIEGDWRHRELSAGLGPAELEIAHTHFNHQSALEDLDSVYPIHRLKELAAGGVIGELADRVYSISGYCLRADLLVKQTIPAIVQGMREDGVQAALFIPV